MTTPIGSIQGLSSGIKWQDMVDQLMQIDSTRELTPLQTQSTAASTAMTAWNTYGNMIGGLQTVVKRLADGTAFATAAISVPNSPSTGRSLLGATVASDAPAATYNVQVLDIAAAQQLSGNVVADTTAALGISGQFIIGGSTITIANTDSLTAIRDKINAADVGDTPSRVSATILSTGSATNRLVLSSDVAGAAGIDIRDVRASGGDPSVLTQLGLINGSATNLGANGAVLSALFTSATQTIAAMTTGVAAYPPASTINVGGRAITVDLATQSLTDIAAAINAQLPNTASVETVTNGSTTSYRLNVSSSAAATGAAGSQPILDLLGLTRGLTGVVKQQVTTGNVLLDSSAMTATSSTLLAGLKIAGGTGAQVGDTFTIAGTKADGTTKVNLTETVDGTKTIADLLSDISTAFSAPGRSVSAAIVGGRIQLTDDSGGDSGLTFSIGANNESTADPLNPSTLSFGAATVTTVGRQRELAQGKDARITVNGISVTRSTNAITDAIPGVTLNLRQSEANTTIPVTVTHDNGKVVDAVNSLASAYNSVLSWVNTNTAAGGPLPYSAAVRQTLASIKNALLQNVVGLPGSSAYTNGAVVGVAFNKDGTLGVDATALNAALARNPDAVAALFKTNGVTTDANYSYIGSDATTAAGAYGVTITRAATVASAASSATNFVYAAGASSDTMTVTDATSTNSGNITLVNGDTVDSVAQKLNTMFSAQRLRLAASNDAGRLTIKALDYGATPSFTLAYASTDATDVAGQIGLAAGVTHNGLDVRGSFTDGTNSYTATGKGQLLTGDADTAVDGLTVKYAGTADSSTGHIDFAAGIAGILGRIADQVSRVGDGTVTTQMQSLQSRIDALALRQDDVQTRLDTRRAALLAQFTAMETALSKIQQQSIWLTNQINAMSGLQSSSK